MLRLICESINVIPEDSQTILRALNHKEWNDIEDALQMQCAKQIGVRYIVTQNLKDFSTSETEAINEEEFCKIINSAIS